VRVSPSASGVVGCQARRVAASAMSGQRWTGSSTGSGRRVMGEREPVNAITSSASSATEVSCGLPKLTGPVTWSAVAISRTNPSIKSSTKQKARVCEPSP
jgi:hypothetical protein